MVEDMNEAMAEKGFDGLIEAFGNSLAELAQMAMEAAPTLIGVAEGPGRYVHKCHHGPPGRICRGRSDCSC